MFFSLFNPNRYLSNAFFSCNYHISITKKSYFNLQTNFLRVVLYKQKKHCAIHPFVDRLLLIQSCGAITLISVDLLNFHLESTSLYSLTLDKLHDVIQNITSPFILLGDMNAQMPHTAQLSAHWYTSKPYNNHSMLLYDLACD